MASQFCGRCGAPLTPGAAFCGVCRTPVSPASPVAVAAYPQQYVYPYAPPQHARIGSGRTTQVAVAAGLIVILVVVAIVTSVFAYRSLTGSHQSCTANCSPKVITPLQAAATYRSSAFKFEVDYSTNWTVRNQDANGITLGTRLGQVSVAGSKSGQSPDQAIQGVVAALPSANWQAVKNTGGIQGSHLGNVDGVGQMYTANLIGANSKAVAVRVAVIAATKGGVTVVVFAVDPNDPHFPNGMQEGYLFDYMCTQFRWG